MKGFINVNMILTNRGASAVFDVKVSVPEGALRDESHRLADRLIGALTGQNGGFASHLTFAQHTAIFQIAQRLFNRVIRKDAGIQ